MIVLCLGLPSSASTWAFNVVRGLLAESHPDMLGVYAENAQSFHEAVPAGTKNVVLKTHSMDDALCRLVEASDSPMILTWRDPRDAAVSLSQRTGQDLRKTLQDLQRSAACVLSIKERRHERMAIFDYADDCMNRIEPIQAIARCLGVDASAQLVQRLHRSLRTDAVRRNISSWSKELGPEATFSTGFDLSTHWHKNHLGDARTGKWKDADAASVDLLDAMLGGHQAMFRSGGQGEVVLPWKEVARGRMLVRPLPGVPAVQSPAQQAEVYLPRGWWSAEFNLHLAGSGDRLFELRVEAGQGVLAHRLLRPAQGQQSTSLVFEHVQPVEAIRLMCAPLDDNEEIPVEIARVRITRLSNVVEAAENKARRISTQVLPGE